MSLNKIYPLSEDQRNYIGNSHSRINLLDGPTRSGKNFVQNLRLLHAVAHEPFSDPKSDIALFGSTKDAILRNFLNDFFKIIGEHNYTLNSQKGTGTMFGRNFYLFPAKNKDAFKNLRGSNLGLAIGTEITLLDYDFFMEVNNRVSAILDSKIFIDTNPDSPYHYIYKDFISSDRFKTGDFSRFRFTLESNLSLSEEAKDRLKRIYVPGTLRYKRMIEGLWVLSDGVIYTMFDESKNTFDHQITGKMGLKWVVGIDYGSINPTVFGLFAVINGKYYLYQEWYHDSAKDGAMTDEQYLEKLMEFIGSLKIDAVYCDPAATHFINEIRSKTRLPIYNPYKDDSDDEEFGDLSVDKSVLDGIQTVQSAFYNNKLMIHKSCKNTLTELTTYIWDEQASIKRGRDVPLKKNDHCLDMTRYVLQSHSKKKDPMEIWRALASA